MIACPLLAIDALFRKALRLLARLRNFILQAADQLFSRRAPVTSAASVRASSYTSASDLGPGPAPARLLQNLRQRFDPVGTETITISGRAARISSLFADHESWIIVCVPRAISGHRSCSSGYRPPPRARLQSSQCHRNARLQRNNTHNKSRLVRPLILNATCSLDRCHRPRPIVQLSRYFGLPLTTLGSASTHSIPAPPPSPPGLDSD